MPPRARMSGPERHEQLLLVGRAVFAERGFSAATIEEIADRAKVSKPIVYQHFGGKDGLYAEIVDREVDRVMTMIVEALNGAEGPRAAVERAAEAFLTYVETERDGFRILVRDAPVGTTEGTLPTLLDDVAAKAEATLFREFAARGFDTGAAPLYARGLVGMVALVGEWWLRTERPGRKEVAAHLVNLAWNGLRGLELLPWGDAASG